MIQNIILHIKKKKRERERERLRERGCEIEKDQCFMSKGCNAVNALNMELNRHTWDVSSFMCNSSPCVSFLVPNS